MLEDSMKTRVSASDGTVQVAKCLRAMSEEERKVAETKIKLLKKLSPFTMLRHENKQLKDITKSLFQLLLKKSKRDLPCLRMMNRSKRLMEPQSRY